MMTHHIFTFRAELTGDAAAIEHLLDHCFGPGRHVLTAYRLREGVDPIAELGLVAFEEDRLIGSVRFWPILIGASETPALLLGPLAVDPARRNLGAGIALMRRGLELATAAGHRLVILVGDAPYYARAGFKPVPHGQITLSGPYDPDRLLAFECVAGALAQAEGEVGKALSDPRGTRQGP